MEKPFIDKTIHLSLSLQLAALIVDNLDGFSIRDHTGLKEAVGGNLAQHLENTLPWYVDISDVFDTTAFVTTATTSTRAAIVAATASVASDANDEKVGIAAVQAIWRAVLSIDTSISAIVRGMMHRTRAFDPAAIVDDLLDVNISTMQPIVRCFYTWSVGELLQDLPPDEELDMAYNNFVTDCGCGPLFERVSPAISPSLLPILGDVHGDTEVGIKSLIGSYIDRPPTRTEVLQRLRA